MASTNAKHLGVRAAPRRFFPAGQFAVAKLAAF
jgi:hypothetical protein